MDSKKILKNKEAVLHPQMDEVQYVETHTKVPTPMLMDSELESARKGSYAELAMAHRIRLQQLKANIVQEKFAQRSLEINRGMEMTDAMNHTEVSEALHGMQKDSLFKQFATSYIALQRELDHGYSDDAPISEEEWNRRQSIKYRAYKEIFEQYTGVSDTARDFDYLEKYQKMLANYAAKYNVALEEQSVYAQVQKDDYATKGLLATDALLIRAYNEGDNQENIALIYHLIQRPPMERLFIYGLIEKDLIDGADLLDIVNLTGNYIPNPEEILNKLTPNSFFQFFGKTNLYTKKIMKAIQLCDKSKDAIQLITSTTQILTGPVSYEDEDAFQQGLAAQESEAIILQRAAYFNECLRIAEAIKNISSTKPANDREKEVQANKIENLRKVMFNEFIGMIKLDNMLPDEEEAKAGTSPKYKEPAKQETSLAKKAGKVAVGVALASPKFLNLGTNIVKQPINVIGSMGAAIKMVSLDPVSAMQKKWNLPAETIKSLNEANKGDKIAAVADLAKTLKPTLNALNIIGTALSGILLVMSGVSYLKGFLKMTMADRVVGAVDIGNSSLGVGNSINTVCKGFEVGNVAAEGIVGGALSIAIGTVNAGIGTYQIADNYFVRKKEREAAKIGLTEETNLLKQQYAASYEEAVAKDKIKEKMLFDKNMLMLSEKIAERRNSAAVHKILGGALTVGAGILLLAGGPVLGALLGVTALGLGIHSMISGSHDKKEAMRAIIDETLGVNRDVNIWIRRKKVEHDSLIANDYRQAIRRDRYQSLGFSNEKAFYSHLMMGYAKQIHFKIFNNRVQDAQIYEDLVKSMGLKVKPAKGYPTVQMIHAKLMS